MLASRYRIIGLVGKGGMGEVYKAEDLQLSQVVALKFLPESVVGDEDMLASFRGEVRNARQVSHVNVCRVFDIGEIDGRHFLSMEFVDGDDLSELLTRVGRFTSERAVEISRQLCVGMEAIHKAGILHRDLKPANIIIDKKGVARITDFGIAGIEADMKGDNIRAGTPAYMSPEQISGKEVTARSDIYALGLVIYEIFTGKQAFIADNVMELIKMHQTATATSPSTHVKGIDPLVESVIAQCLEKNPKDRPQSALQVAMALPGGNPLQIALDAGQTPSPEMVAASPKKGALRPIVAISLLAAVFISFGLLIVVSRNFYLHRMVPLDKPPEVLRERSRELADKFGYSPADSYYEFAPPTAPSYLSYLTETDRSPDVWQKLKTAQPALITFWYRSSPVPLAPLTGLRVNYNDPKNDYPGMVRLRLDTKGRLLEFSGVPPRIDEPVAASGEFDWANVFKEAGFDISAFQETQPQVTPPQAFDQRRAFSGVYPEAPDIQIRVEAFAYRGKLVYLQIVEPWTQLAPVQAGVAGSIWAGLVTYFGILLFSILLSVRNIRVGRSDQTGAFRVSVFIFAARMIVWAFATHHVASGDEINPFISGLESGLYWAATAGLMYLAFEPYLRKSAPERVISWNRLLAGDWRDPLVGRDILIGAAAAAVLNLIYVLVGYVLPVMQAKPTYVKITDQYNGAFNMMFVGVSGFPALLMHEVSNSLLTAFVISFMILFMGLLLRRKNVGVAAVCLIWSVVSIATSLANNQDAYGIAVTILGLNLFLLVPARFGVLALISMFMFSNFYHRPLTTDLTAWYASEFVLYTLFLTALAIFGFYTSTAGQKLWQGKLLGDGD